MVGSSTFNPLIPNAKLEMDANRKKSIKMKLTEYQVQNYFKKGYLILEGLLSEREIKVMKSSFEKFEKLKKLPNIICEKDGTIRSVFKPNLHDKIFDDIFRDDRFVIPSMQLIKDDIYLYQYKLNCKRPFSGQMWEWHQDFAYWQLDDGVQNTDMVSIMTYLDDTKSYQGPLMVIPGSHKFDIVDFQKKEALLNKEQPLINALGADLKYTVNEKYIKDLANRFGIDVLEGRAGTTILFHPNLFHASNGNISPFNRDTVILTYNSVNNLPLRKGNRPDFVCSTDYRPLRVLAKAS